MVFFAGLYPIFQSMRVAVSDHNTLLSLSSTFFARHGAREVLQLNLMPARLLIPTQTVYPDPFFVTMKYSHWIAISGGSIKNIQMLITWNLFAKDWIHANICLNALVDRC